MSSFNPQLNSPFTLGGNFVFQTPAFQLPMGASPMPILASMPAYTMPALGASNQHATPGFHFSLPQPNLAMPAIGQPSFHSSGDPKSSGVGVVTGTAKVLVKDQLPPVAKTVGVVASAAISAQKLVERSEQAVSDGQTPLEAYACQTANILTKEATGKVMKGAVVGGIIPYLEASAAFAPLALTIPVVAPQIPVAYQAADAAAHYLGRGAEDICHNAFDQARKLSNGGQ